MLNHSSRSISILSVCILMAFLAILAVPRIVLAQRHVIEVLADKDSRYKIAGKSNPVITVKAGEPLLLRITARKGSSWNEDGTVHGFALIRSKDHSTVDGWNFFLKPGTQEFEVSAPAEAGQYEVLCTVICSDDHEGMRMKFVVLP